MRNPRFWGTTPKVSNDPKYKRAPRFGARFERSRLLLDRCHYTTQLSRSLIDPGRGSKSACALMVFPPDFFQPIAGINGEKGVPKAQASGVRFHAHLFRPHFHGLVKGRFRARNYLDNVTFDKFFRFWGCVAGSRPPHTPKIGYIFVNVTFSNYLG